MAVGQLIGLVIVLVIALVVYFDARSIGSDQGRHPNLIDTQPVLWAVGIFLLCILALPSYLFMRGRYQRQAAERLALQMPPPPIPGQWPPPPTG